jgi:poly(3-hydroxybutyrate) depolymerase
MNHHALLAFVCTAFAVGCSSSPTGEVADGAVAQDGATTDGAATDGGSPLDAAPSQDGGTADAGPDVRVLTDRKLAGFPHTFDIYTPRTPKRVVVFLHGGGGSKEGGGDQLGLRVESGTAPNTTVAYDTAWLGAHDVAFVFPQGQAKAGTRGFTWNNYVMTSDVDDVAFLAALSSAIRGGTLDNTVPAIPRIAVSGHSNGGMMTNRLWCEAPQAFDAFIAFAGPASVHLGVSGYHPCTPAAQKPYLGYVGGKDTVLQTDGNWLQDVWTIGAPLANTPGFVDPNLVNELTFHKTVRVPKTCAGPIGTPSVGNGGATTTWSDCGGKTQLVRVTNADHCMSGTKCTHTFESETGRRMIDVLTEFFTAQAP